MSSQPLALDFVGRPSWLRRASTPWARVLARWALCALFALGSSGCTQSRPAALPRAAAVDPSTLLSARVRRLSNQEYENTVHALLGTDAAIATRLPPDIRTDGFTQNGDNPVHSAWASRVATLAEELSRAFVESHPERVCPRAGDCAASFVDEFGLRAFRRPLSAAEQRALSALYDQAAADSPSSASTPSPGEVRGAQAVLSVLLQAPSTIYLSELGSPTESQSIQRLSHYEVANTLAYMIRGGPPDEPLLVAASQEQLYSSAERTRQALRLLSLSDTRHQFRRFVTEWLEVDQLPLSSKDADVSEDYDVLKHRMLAETHAYIDETLVHRGASVRALLNSAFVSVDPSMARYYGLEGWGPRVPSNDIGRLGLLQQASFLSAHAHPSHSSPVLRGDFVLRRLLCVNLPRPAEVGIETVMPPRTTNETTRERFARHVSSPGCATCHRVIDPLGYAFEDFDAGGRVRSLENERAVKTSGTFEYQELSINFENSQELTQWLAEQPRVAQCFRRYAFRFFTSRSDPRLDPVLENIVQSHLAKDDRPNLLLNLVAYAQSDGFIFRKAQP